MNPILYKIGFLVYRNLYWVILLGFLLMLFAYMSHVIYNQKVQLEYTQQVSLELSKELAGVKNILSQNTNEHNQEQTKVQAFVGDKETLQMMFQANSEFREQLKNLDIKLSTLQSVTKLSVTTSGEFTTVLQDSIVTRIEEKQEGSVIRKDTIREEVTMINFKEKSGWFEMSGSIKEQLQDSVMVKTMQFNPIFYEEYDVGISYERIPKQFFLDLFPPKRTVATVFNHNPYSRTNKVKTIVQPKEKKKLFGIL